MSVQSLYLCGFPEVRVEMKVAPFRALTHSGSGFVVYLSSRVEMKVALFRASTPNNIISVLMASVSW